MNKSDILKTVGKTMGWSTLATLGVLIYGKIISLLIRFIFPCKTIDWPYSGQEIYCDTADFLAILMTIASLTFVAVVTFIRFENSRYN